MNFFREREDVFPKRWENKKTRKSGYAPACQNEWVKGVCKKPQIKCSECLHQAFLPVTKQVIRNLLSQLNCIMWIYPILKDETCWFLAIDFDKENWKRDVSIFLETCHFQHVPVRLEHSRPPAFVGRPVIYMTLDELLERESEGQKVLSEIAASFKLKRKDKQPALLSNSSMTTAGFDHAEEGCKII